jgi:integrase
VERKVHIPTIEPRAPIGGATQTPDKPKRKYTKRKRPLEAQTVKLIQRTRRTGVTFLARWQDPITGKWKQESLTRLGFTDEAGARKWCADKAADVHRLAQAKAAGKAVVTETPVAAAIAKFVEAKQGEDMKPGTLTVYSEATTPFTEWAAQEGLRHVEQLTGPKLFDFRNWLVKQPARAQVKGHGLGKGKAATAPSARKRSPETINKKLRAMRTVAGFWRRLGLCPELSTDLIRDSLKFVKVKHKKPPFLRVNQIRALLEAVARHDADLTDGRGHAHPPIGDFLLAALLSGMRFSELANLKWSAVDLDAQEISLSEHDTKTGHARTVTLHESPALFALLSRRKLSAGRARFVFGPMRRDVAEAARRRLVKEYDAPPFQWHLLRKTCGTFLSCSPGIYGGAGFWLAAKRAGHSATIAEKHYCGLEKKIDPTATTLEAAMQIADLVPAPINQQEGQGVKRG